MVRVEVDARAGGIYYVDSNARRGRGSRGVAEIGTTVKKQLEYDDSFG